MAIQHPRIKRSHTAWHRLGWKETGETKWLWRGSNSYFLTRSFQWMLIILMVSLVTMVKSCRPCWPTEWSTISIIVIMITMMSITRWPPTGWSTWWTTSSSHKTRFLSLRLGIIIIIWHLHHKLTFSHAETSLVNNHITRHQNNDITALGEEEDLPLGRSDQGSWPWRDRSGKNLTFRFQILRNQNSDVFEIKTQMFLKTKLRCF